MNLLSNIIQFLCIQWRILFTKNPQAGDIYKLVFGEVPIKVVVVKCVDGRVYYNYDDDIDGIEFDVPIDDFKTWFIKDN